MSARSLFVGGTASHVGKSWLATAICRWLRNRGVLVAPFKAQNMSNNSFPARGGEIGRAQAAQAEACGLEPVTDMNPILLKPHSQLGAQVIVNGKVWRDLSAAAYGEHFDLLLGHVLDAYQRLAHQYEFIVIEGAGSVAEINLRCRDLVNFGLACRLSSPALLVADIDRGGVFASLIGSFSLLQQEESRLVRSFAVNRFRGDRSLFSDGVDFLEKQTERPCLGVFPARNDLHLDEEDGVSLDGKGAIGAETAILRFPHISNISDFRSLQADWIAAPNRRLYTHIILPGTKNTTGDLYWLREQKLDDWIGREYAAGASIIGVCGGYQMLGREIVESGSSYPGLSFLPVSTIMRAEKTVRAVTACTPCGARFDAYEIHMGETPASDADPFAFAEGKPEGIRSGRCVGTYLHGALESTDVLRELGIESTPLPSREHTYDELARWFDTHADTRLFEELYL
jgi:adenosylcobyric acid synthase